MRLRSTYDEAATFQAGKIAQPVGRAVAETVGAHSQTACEQSGCSHFAFVDVAAGLVVVKVDQDQDLRAHLYCAFGDDGVDDDGVGVGGARVVVVACAVDEGQIVQWMKREHEPVRVR